MDSAAFVSISEYLHTSYRPECDYVDGEVRERNVGIGLHPYMLSVLCGIFHTHRKTWQVFGLPAVRVQTSTTRILAPDVTVVRKSDPNEPVILTAPLICIEIIALEDTCVRMRERIDDYIAMGVEHIWLIDPVSRRAWVATADGTHKPANAEFAVPGTPIRISLAEVFAELDDMLT